MRVLVACEESQAVTKELRRLGHEAYSCDIVPCSGGHPEWHIQRDVIPLLNGFCEFKTADGESHLISGKWDMIIAHPPAHGFAIADSVGCTGGAKNTAPTRSVNKRMQSCSL